MNQLLINSKESFPNLSRINAAALRMVSCFMGPMAAAVAVFLLMPAPGRASPVDARGLRDGSQNRYVCLMPSESPLAAPIHIFLVPLIGSNHPQTAPVPFVAVVRADVSMAVRVPWVP